MRRPGPTFVSLLIGLFVSACTHTYIYSPRTPPTIEGDSLVVRKSSGVDRLGIRRVIISELHDPFTYRRATSQELADIASGSVPEGIDTLRIEVDTTAVMWRDWALTGFGIGASTVLLLVGLTGSFEPASGEFGLTVPVTLLFASLVGTEFMFIGLGLGAAFESGDTDMRIRHLDDDQ